VSAPEPLLSAEQVAEWLAVPRLRVYELGRLGEIPAVRIGRTVRFARAAVEEWIAAGGTPRNGDEAS
jgi:excisionase family DNA binding protein